MIPSDFRRICLTMEGAEESSHMGAADFRVGGRIFATLACQAEGYANLMLTPEVQAAFVEEAPELFLPVKVAGDAWAQPTSVSRSRTKNR